MIDILDQEVVPDTKVKAKWKNPEMKAKADPGAG